MQIITPKLGKSPRSGLRVLRVLLPLLLGSLVILLGLWYSLPWWVELPPDLVKGRPPSLILTDREGSPLRSVAGSHGIFEPCMDQDLSPSVVAAFLSAEDHRFFYHPGVDPIAVSRVLHTGKGGASTITQQTAKLALGTGPRTVKRKLHETLLALRMERTMSKREILMAYLDRLEFARLNTGLRSASQYWFQKPASDLTLGEAALLAAMPKAPGRLYPGGDDHALETRRQWILSRTQKAASAEHSTFKQTVEVRPARTFEAPHFSEMLISQLEPDRTGTVMTSLDAHLQKRVSEIAGQHLGKLRHRNATQAAVVVIHVPTGEILALLGSKDYHDPRDGGGMNNGSTAIRAPGSTLKPFTYLLAFEQGWTPDSPLLDTGTLFSTGTGLWRVRNYSRKEHGVVPARKALACSLNIATVKLLEAIGGPSPLVTILDQFGITTLEKDPAFYGLGLTLGNAGIRLLELTNAYAALAREGLWQPVQFQHDTTPGLRQSQARRVASQASCRMVTEILSDNLARAPEFGLNSKLKLPFPMAVKTGTSTSFRDSWALGYTRDFAVGVWVGNFDNSPMSEVAGATGAAAVLHDVAIAAAARYSDAEKFQELTPPTARPARSWTASAQLERKILSPLDGARFLLDPDLPDSGSWVRLQAGVEGQWMIHGLETQDRGGKTWLKLLPGQHEVRLQPSDGGEALLSRFEVGQL